MTSEAVAMRCMAVPTATAPTSMEIVLQPPAATNYQTRRGSSTIHPTPRMKPSIIIHTVLRSALQLFFLHEESSPKRTDGLVPLLSTQTRLFNRSPTHRQDAAHPPSKGRNRHGTPHARYSCGHRSRICLRPEDERFQCYTPSKIRLTTVLQRECPPLTTVSIPP